MQRVSKVFKELRGPLYQDEFATSLNLSREMISKIENGSRNIPRDITHHMIKKYNSPKLAITVQQEATGTGPIWLDGEATDLHRSAVKERAIEETREALEAIESTSLAVSLKNISGYRKTDVERMLKEVAQSIVTQQMFLSVICTEANVNYSELWDEVYSSLISNGYLEV